MLTFYKNKSDFLFICSLFLFIDDNLRCVACVACCIKPSAVSCLRRFQVSCLRQFHACGGFMPSAVSSFMPSAVSGFRLRGFRFQACSTSITRITVNETRIIENLRKRSATLTKRPGALRIATLTKKDEGNRQSHRFIPPPRVEGNQRGG